MGYVDVATKKFIPEVSAIRDDTSLLKKLIKSRAILGYIDPETLKFVKEDPPKNLDNIKILKSHRYTGVVNGMKVLLGFMDPNHSTLA